MVAMVAASAFCTIAYCNALQEHGPSPAASSLRQEQQPSIFLDILLRKRESPLPSSSDNRTYTPHRDAVLRQKTQQQEVPLVNLADECLALAIDAREDTICPNPSPDDKLWLFSGDELPSVAWAPLGGLSTASGEETGSWYQQPDEESPSATSAARDSTPVQEKGNGHKPMEIPSTIQVKGSLAEETACLKNAVGQSNPDVHLDGKHYDAQNLQMGDVGAGQVKIMGFAEQPFGYRGKRQDNLHKLHQEIDSEYNHRSSTVSGRIVHPKNLVDERGCDLHKAELITDRINTATISEINLPAYPMTDEEGCRKKSQELHCKEIGVLSMHEGLSYEAFTSEESTSEETEEKVQSIPLVEDLYEEIIVVVLQIARSLSKNKMLDEFLDPYLGRIDTICGNVILRKLHTEHLFRQALSFFEWMRLHRPCLLDSRSLCTIFTLLGDASMCDRAFTLFNNYKECRIAQFVQVYNALLSGLLKHNRLAEVLQVFQVMTEKRIQPDSVTFCILIIALQRSGSGLEDVWKFFCDMEAEVFASHTVFGALIKAFCENGLLEEAVVLMSEMERRGLKPNVVIYNILINAYGKAGMMQAAEGLVCEMKEKRVSLSVITYNLLIDAYGRQGKPEVGEALLQEMIDAGLTPNARSYTPLITAYARLQLSEKAASMLLRMKRNGVHPNVFSYAALIHAYAETGWPEKAKHTFDNMLREGLMPNVEVYTSLMHGYRQAGEIEGVQFIWKRMLEENCQGTRVTFNVLMDAYAKNGYYGEARDAMFIFAKLGHNPDRKTFNMLINAYARGGQHAKVPDLLSEMEAAGFSPDSFTYTTLIFTFLRVRDFTAAFHYHDMMCKSNQLPDQLTYSKLRAILDAKFEARLVKNMGSVIGLQERLYGSNTKKVKVFHKRRPPISRTGRTSSRIRPPSS